MSDSIYSKIRRAMLLLALTTFAALSILTACISGEGSTQTPAGSTQVSNSETAPSDPNVLFQDDFSDPSSGWNVRQSESIIREYVEGEFRAFVDNTEFAYFYPAALIEGNFGDVRLEVDVRRVSGADSASAYLICRRAAERNYVFGDVDSEGEARVGIVIGDMQEILADEEGIPGLRDGANRLRLDCLGDMASLYVGDTLVATAEVDGPSEGQVGFAAGGATEGQTDFRFDNFIVYRGDVEVTLPAGASSAETFPQAEAAMKD